MARGDGRGWRRDAPAAYVREWASRREAARRKGLAWRGKLSAATVTRFCRSVGCRGLRELKLDLARILAVGDRYLHPRIAVTRTSEAVTEILSRIHRSLDTLVDQISDETLKRAASAIAGAKRVMIFGGGGAPRWSPWKPRIACSGWG